MTEGFAPPPTPDLPEARASRGEPAPVARAPRRRPARRRGVVLAWIIGGAAAVAIGGGVIADVALTANASRLQPVERGFTGRLEGVQAVAGLCLLEAPVGDAVGSLTAVPCGEPHRAETLAHLEWQGAWPGDDAVAAEATEFCAARVARAVPEQLADALRWRVWVPTARTWAAGDRTALCVVTGDGDVTGSVEAGTAALS